MNIDGINRSSIEKIDRKSLEIAQKFHRKSIEIAPSTRERSTVPAPKNTFKGKLDPNQGQIVRLCSYTYSPE